MKKRISSLFSSLRKAMMARPFASFLGVLVVLFILVFVGNKLRKPPVVAKQDEQAPKQVAVYQLSGTPQVTVQAKIEKSGVIKLIAQSAGVVQSIKVHEGAHVGRGTTIIALSTSYQGGNIPSISRQIAQKSSQFQNETYDTQRAALQNQRQIATLAETQASQLRSIAQQSIADTQDSINLGNDVIGMIDAQVNMLRATDVGGSNQALILQALQGKAGALASLNAAKAALRSAQYQTDDSKEPANIARSQRDATLQQLDVQEKTLNLNRDLAALNLRIAQVSESLMYPAAPCSGKVERVYVHVGQAVSPGTVLATLRGDVDTATAIALVSTDIAQNISRLLPAQLTIGAGKSISLQPRSISDEPTDGTLHAVIFSIPDEFGKKLSDGSYVEVQLPIGVTTAAQSQYIPLDAVYQTQDAAYVYVLNKKDQNNVVAQTKQVTLGAVYGHYVELLGGLQPTDTVIVDRNVIDGERVVSK